MYCIMKGGRQLSKWNLFVKKIYDEGKTKNANYQFKQALEDASKHKSEMGNMKNTTTARVKKGKKSKGKSLMSTGGTRRRRRR